MRLVCVSLSSAPASARARLSPHFPYSAPVSFKLVAQCPPKSTLQSWCVSKKLFFSPGPRMSNFISYLSKRHVLMFEIRVASSGHPVIHMHVSFGIHLRTPGRTRTDGRTCDYPQSRRRRRPSRVLLTSDDATSFLGFQQPFHHLSSAHHDPARKK